MTTRDDTIQRGPVAIKNVAAFMAMTMKVVERAPHLPGFGVCHGPSGYGKTWASIFAQNKTNAIRVEVGDSWTRRTLLSKVLGEFGENTSRRETVSDLADRAINALGEDQRRPLLVDEADRLVDRGLIEILRELQESSGAPVILIGEEKLPAKLLTVERVHNRVLEWFPAQPCDLEDTRELAKAFAPKLKIADELLDAIRAQSGGRARRIVTNLEEAKDIARNKSLSAIDLSAWGSRRFHTGEPPQTRHIEQFAKKLGARVA